ncbi:hypothetical protein DIPPA_23549 [Diplonema papillatum]|nr:hypothetical protein DIPPA_23549 [Diplonema papillatum]
MPLPVRYDRSGGAGVVVSADLRGCCFLEDRHRPSAARPPSSSPPASPPPRRCAAGGRDRAAASRSRSPTLQAQEPAEGSAMRRRGLSSALGGVSLPVYTTRLSPTADLFLKALFVALCRGACLVAQKHTGAPARSSSASTGVSAPAEDPDADRYGYRYNAARGIADEEAAVFVMSWSLFCKLLRKSVCCNSFPLYVAVSSAVDMRESSDLDAGTDITLEGFKNLFLTILECRLTGAKLDVGRRAYSYEKANRFVEDNLMLKYTTIAPQFGGRVTSLDQDVVFDGGVVRATVQRNSALEQLSHPKTLRLLHGYHEPLTALFCSFWHCRSCSVLADAELLVKRSCRGLTVRGLTRLFSTFGVKVKAKGSTAPPSIPLSEQTLAEMLGRYGLYLEPSALLSDSDKADAEPEVGLQGFIDCLAVVAHCQTNPGARYSKDCSTELLRLLSELKVTSRDRLEAALKRAGPPSPPRQADPAAARWRRSASGGAPAAAGRRKGGLACRAETMLAGEGVAAVLLPAFGFYSGWKADRNTAPAIACSQIVRLLADSFVVWTDFDRVVKQNASRHPKHGSGCDSVQDGRRLSSAEVKDVFNAVVQDSRRNAASYEEFEQILGHVAAAYYRNREGSAWFDETVALGRLAAVELSRYAQKVSPSLGGVMEPDATCSDVLDVYYAPLRDFYAASNGCFYKLLSTFRQADLIPSRINVSNFKRAFRMSTAQCGHRPPKPSDPSSVLLTYASFTNLCLRMAHHIYYNNPLQPNMHDKLVAFLVDCKIPAVKR